MSFDMPLHQPEAPVFVGSGAVVIKELQITIIIGYRSVGRIKMIGIFYQVVIRSQAISHLVGLSLQEDVFGLALVLLARHLRSTAIAGHSLYC